MTEDEMSEGMQQLLREIDTPPTPPREEMWARIQAERAQTRPAAGADDGDSRDVATETSRDVIDIRPRRRVAVWVQLSAALAAMLVLGIGIGRVSRGPAAAPGQNEVAATDAPAGDVAPGPYRLAAAEHMRRTETLLVSMRVDEPRQSTTEMQSWASELLTNTRLLLASPAARDDDTRKLLEDLELVLSQIAVMPAAQVDEEVKLIQDGLNQSDVLLRLRAATAGPRLVGT